MERTTKKMINNVFEIVAKELGKSIITYDNDKKVAIVGTWRIDNVPVYGGYTIEEMHNEQGAVHHPFGMRRMKPSQFYYFLQSIWDGILNGSIQGVK